MAVLDVAEGERRSTNERPQDRLEVNAHSTPQWNYTPEGVLASSPRWGLGARGLACALLSSILNAYVQKTAFATEVPQFACRACFDDRQGTGVAPQLLPQHHLGAGADTRAAFVA